MINIGHINDERDSWHLGSEKFKEYVEEHSGGRIQVNIYPSSQLGTEVDMIQSILTQGGCDITFTGESMQTYQPDLGIIGMPYLIKSDEHMEAVLTGEAGAELEGLDGKVRYEGPWLLYPRPAQRDGQQEDHIPCRYEQFRHPYPSVRHDRGRI